MYVNLNMTVISIYIFPPTEEKVLSISISSEVATSVATLVSSLIIGLKTPCIIFESNFLKFDIISSVKSFLLFFNSIKP